MQIEKTEECPDCGSDGPKTGFNFLNQTCLCGWGYGGPAGERRSRQGDIVNAPYRDWWRDLLRDLHRIRERHQAIADVLASLDHDLAPQQAAILPHMADRRARTAGWMIEHAYVGSNSSYNLRVLADKGYLVCRTPDGDRRRRLYRLTDRGAQLAEVLKATFEGVASESEPRAAGWPREGAADSAPQPAAPRGSGQRPLKPLSEPALAVLRQLMHSPIATQEINPGIVRKLTDEGLAEIVGLPSPYDSHKGANCNHLKITDKARQLIAAARSGEQGVG